MVNVHAQKLGDYLTGEYQAFRERLRQEESDAAAKEEIRRRDGAQDEAMQRCRNAISDRALIDCVKRYSDDFEAKYRARFQPRSEARFKVLDELERKVSAMTAQSTGSAARPALNARVQAHCEQLGGFGTPAGLACMDRLTACLRITRTDQRNACLGGIENERSANVPPQTRAPTPAKREESADCKILDDIARSEHLLKANPGRYDELVESCNS